VEVGEAAWTVKRARRVLPVIAHVARVVFPPLTIHRRFQRNPPPCLLSRSSSLKALEGQVFFCCDAMITLGRLRCVSDGTTCLTLPT
jgi:hypothetical protein